MSSTEAASRAAWSGKLMFVLSAAASAVGLGSMWRFPYLSAKYGGGTFLFTYLVLMFTIGVALLLLETALGRKTGQSAIGAFKVFGKKYAFIGIFTSAVPFIIASYYCVIGGWVTRYLAGYAMGEVWRWPMGEQRLRRLSVTVAKASSLFLSLWCLPSLSWDAALMVVSKKLTLS